MVLIRKTCSAEKLLRNLQAEKAQTLHIEAILRCLYSLLDLTPSNAEICNKETLRQWVAHRKRQLCGLGGRKLADFWSKATKENVFVELEVEEAELWKAVSDKEQEIEKLNSVVEQYKEKVNSQEESLLKLRCHAKKCKDKIRVFVQERKRRAARKLKRLQQSKKKKEIPSPATARRIKRFVRKTLCHSNPDSIVITKKETPEETAKKLDTNCISARVFLKTKSKVSAPYNEVKRVQHKLDVVASDPRLLIQSLIKDQSSCELKVSKMKLGDKPGEYFVSCQVSVDGHNLAKSSGITCSVSLVDGSQKESNVRSIAVIKGVESYATMKENNPWTNLGKTLFLLALNSVCMLYTFPQRASSHHLLGTSFSSSPI